MQRIKWLSVILAAVAVVTLTGWQSFGQAKGSSPLALLMQKKLQNSHRVLEGLVMADFNKVQSSAEELIQLSRKDDWFVHKTPKYELFTNEFRRAAENLIQKARDKNEDGTAYAYLEMTMTCVRCHKYVREIRDARGPAIPHDPLALTFARPPSPATPRY